ncbi:hypothetical protein, partial [Methylomonas albis]
GAGKECRCRCRQAGYIDTTFFAPFQSRPRFPFGFGRI